MAFFACSFLRLFFFTFFYFISSYLTKQKLSLFLNNAKQLAANRTTNMAEYRIPEL